MMSQEVSRACNLKYILFILTVKLYVISLFQSCLTTIYWSFLSGNSKSLEGLVGCVLGFVRVPPAGGPKMTFSMGAGDRQTLCPPTSETLPVTGKSVSILFNQLGKLYKIHYLFNQNTQRVPLIIQE